MTARSQIARWLAAGFALAALAGCSAGAEPGPDGPTTSQGSARGASGTGGPKVSAAKVRQSLARIDPCALLTPPGGHGTDAPYRDGPHTCKGEVDGVRLTVEVGVPFDEAARERATRRSVAGLAAYRDPDRCRTLFATTGGHAVTVRLDRDDCAALDPAAKLVGGVLSKGGTSLLRSAGPDHFTACGLLAQAVDDPGALADVQGTVAAGLDHCEVADGPVSDRERLDFRYLAWPFDRLTQRLQASADRIAGVDVAVVNEGPGTSYVHAYLWKSRSADGDQVSAEAIVTAGSSDRARTLMAAVIKAAADGPSAGGDPTDLLVRAG